MQAGDLWLWLMAVSALGVLVSVAVLRFTWGAIPTEPIRRMRRGAGYLAEVFTVATVMSWIAYLATK